MAVFSDLKKISFIQGVKLKYPRLIQPGILKVIVSKRRMPAVDVASLDCAEKVVLDVSVFFH